MSLRRDDSSDFEEDDFRRKEKYLLFKKIVSIILQHGERKCFIFGGYVRDSILHYEASKSYYKNGHLTQSFCNRQIDPDTFYDRNRVARDIDLFINKECTDHNSETFWKGIIEKLQTQI